MDEKPQAKIKKETEVRDSGAADIVISIVVIPVDVDAIRITVQRDARSPTSFCPDPSEPTTDRPCTLIPRLNFIWSG